MVIIIYELPVPGSLLLLFFSIWAKAQRRVESQFNDKVQGHVLNYTSVFLDSEDKNGSIFLESREADGHITLKPKLLAVVTFDIKLNKSMLF